VGVRHVGETAILLAFVVLQPSEDEQAVAALRTQLRESLPAYMRPARIVVVQALPLLPGHKVDIDALLVLDDTARPGGVSAAPAGTIDMTQAHAVVARAWDAVLDRSAFVAGMPFDEAGGDSLGLLRLVFEVEAQCGVTLPVSIFDLSMRPSEFVRALNEALDGRPIAARGAEARLAVVDVEGPAPPSPLVLLRAGDGAPPVFVAHGVEGHVGGLVRVARHLRFRHPVYALQAGGDVVGRIEDIARCFDDAIETLQPAGPCLLIGYSLGGLIMFELAQRLSQRGRQVGLVALLDTYPHPRFWPSRTWFRWWMRRSRHHASALVKLAPTEVIPRLGHLVGAFIKDIACYFGSSRRPRLAAPPADPVLRRLRAGLMNAEAGYRPHFYPGKLTFLRAETVARMPDDPLGIWGPLAKEIEIITVPGSHISMIFTETLGAHLSDCLDRALSE
jgi:acetoacetyl-CoA synthetase